MKRVTVTATKSAALQPLPKVATGIPGFDELSHGGLPRNRTTLLRGGPGSGKTVFALQSIVNAARRRQEHPAANVPLPDDPHPASIVRTGISPDSMAPW